MTAPDSPRGQPCAFDRTMLFQCLQRIGAAGRLIAAVEPDPWGEDQPIGPHGQGDDMGKRRHGAKIGGVARGLKEVCTQIWFLENGCIADAWGKVGREFLNFCRVTAKPEHSGFDPFGLCGVQEYVYVALTSVLGSSSAAAGSFIPEFLSNSLLPHSPCYNLVFD